MKKGIIIVGPRDSGKTTKSVELSKKFDENDVCFMYRRNSMDTRDPFFFSNCNENTKLVVIEEIVKPREIEGFYNIIASGSIRVEKQCKQGFIISPEIILVCSSKITKEDLSGLSFERRFDIIECFNDHP